MHSDKGGMILGTHIRHRSGKSVQNETLDEGIDEEAEICLSKISSSLREKKKYKPCILLVATDRLHTLQRLIKFAPTINCELEYVDKNKTQTSLTEHGPVSLTKRHLIIALILLF
jgi:hypothetical protein